MDSQITAFFCVDLAMAADSWWMKDEWWASSLNSENNLSVVKELIFGFNFPLINFLIFNLHAKLCHYWVDDDVLVGDDIMAQFGLAVDVADNKLQ